MFRKETVRLWLEIQQMLSKPQTHGMTEKKNAGGKKKNIRKTYCLCLVHAAAATAKLFQSCPTLCDLIGGSPPGSPVPGILQARTLEWVAIAFSMVHIAQ